MTSRDLFVCACLVAVQPSWAGPPDFSLQVVPAVVYQVDDRGNTGTSSFVFDLAVICSTDCSLTPISASVVLSNGRSTVERQEWTTEQLARIKRVNYRILRDTPVASPHRMFALPEAFDLHFYFRRPQALAIDSAAVRVTVADAKGRRVEQKLRIPIQHYRQKTSLIFPFLGHGVVGQDWITNGGHGGGIGTDFAIDVRGLDENYAEQKDSADENASAAGWGREIIAPAAGMVTYARNDVPNNLRPGDPDINSFAAGGGAGSMTEPTAAEHMMSKGRMEAFSDGVLAIIITIMVLELEVPHRADLPALRPLIPVFLSYALSFLYLGIYWTNHHHMLYVTHGVNGTIVWANLHLLFWLSLVPFVTGWMGQNHFASGPTAVYGVILLLAAIAYLLLQHAILREEGPDSTLAAAVGRDRKGKISSLMYAVAILVAFVRPWMAGALYVVAAVMLLVPDRRIEQRVSRARAEVRPVGEA